MKKFFTFDDSDFMPFGVPELEATTLEDLRAEGLTFQPEVGENESLDWQEPEPLVFE